MAWSVSALCEHSVLMFKSGAAFRPSLMTKTELEDAPRSAARWLRAWLVLLHLGTLLAAVVLALLVTRRALLLAALVPIALTPFSYARLRLQRAFAAGLGRGRAALAFAGSGVVLDAVMISQLLVSRGSTLSLLLNAPAITWIGPVWFSAYTLLFVGYALLGASRLAGKALGRMKRRVLPVARCADAAPASLERREFLRQFGSLGAGFPFLISLSNVPLSYDFRVESREIELPHWPRELDGFRVLHLSDIHVGGRMNRERLFRVADLSKSQEPDLVLHTGDFLTHRAGGFDAPLYEALARIAAPHGHWACLGNHDFDDPEGLVQRLAGCGVTTLRNRVVTVWISGHPVEIAGLDYRFWHPSRAGRYAEIVGNWERGRGVPRLLLNHDPTAFKELPEGCADLVLSGHTHGGQIGIQLDSSHALTVVGLAGIPDQGIFRRGDMRLYVTRCVGFYGYPMRIGIPPEIAVLTLRAAPPEPAAA
jgi:predicted MPP superfamily phosphohydrolase